MATHSSTLAWKIPWTEETGRLQSRGHKVSDATERLSLSVFLHEGKKRKTLIFCVITDRKENLLLHFQCHYFTY